MGRALMGAGEASGELRAVDATNAAIANGPTSRLPLAFSVSAITKNKNMGSLELSDSRIGLVDTVASLALLLFLALLGVTVSFKASEKDFLFLFSFIERINTII